MKINTFIFITLGHLFSFSMAFSQIMRSLLTQENTDVFKSFTRLVRAWKISSRGKMVWWFCY